MENKLDLGLPKTQEGIRDQFKEKKAARTRHLSYLTVFFLLLCVALFNLFGNDNSLLINLIIAVFVSAAIVLVLALISRVEVDFESEKMLLSKLNNKGLVEYERFCNTHPILAEYNSTLERLPVFQELEVFREYDKAVEREEIKNRVRNIGAENGK